MMAGQVLAGRYELGERLGVGGMSTVVRAFDDRLERDVAIKLLAEHLADDDQFVARFRREALSVARLVHPNIVQVFDFGLDEPTHRQYIVMELVRGRSGAEILRDEGVLELRDALSIVATATSSPATCCAARTASSSSPTSASPRPSATSPRSRRSARSSARPPTWLPSRRPASRPAPPPTSTRSASSPTS